MSYKATSLWSTTLGLSGSKDDASIENLRVSYEEFRRNAQSLTSKISSSLQDLTIHDISHLDALWEVADVIAGENYPLNPMEAFVFGGAILLHDSALCVEAYSDGLQGIRKSVEWRDAFEAERRRNGNALASDLEKSADFAAMRLLHAHQAATLAERSWTHPSGSGVFHLIENQSLRHHYGALIGKIASSHHWDIERVETELGSQFNALPGYPRNWIVDPVKIACLLRCADALHVDNRRAPDFLHVLAKRHGISGRHWQAQNWLSQPGKLSEDKTGKIVAVTSTRHFPASESQSWWVAFDALKLADKEISSSNDLLARRRFANSPEFETRSIAGSESPERMVSFVRTTGWTPVDAGIHVGNVFELVRSLGGENLYGDGGYVTKLFVVLRELIHNAKDAISARAKFDGSFLAKITVKVTSDADGIWFSVKDNGIGMSKRVLTGPLLDFGSSFWASSLVREEFPGLISSGYRSVGKYGIGFFSTFMLSDNVVVSSRIYKEGLEQTRQLSFANGLSLRPVYSEGQPFGLDMATSTEVRFRLKDEFSESFNDILLEDHPLSGKIAASLLNFIRMMFVYTPETIEIDICGDTDTLHRPHNESKQFYRDTLFQMGGRGEIYPLDERFIDEHSEMMRPIYSGDSLIGVAAINCAGEQVSKGMGTHTIGTIGNPVGRAAGSFVGWIETLPDGAKRNPSANSVDKKAVQAWAKDQYQQVIGKNLNDIQNIFVSYRLSEFDVDVSELVKIPIAINGTVFTAKISDIVGLTRSLPLCIFKASVGDFIETHHQVNSVPGYMLVRPIINGNLNNLTFSEGKPTNPNSLIFMIETALARAGAISSWSLENTVYNATYFGPMQLVRCHVIWP